MILPVIVQAQPGSVPVQAVDELVVIGKRLQTWRGDVSTTLGITTCRTTQSTGDRDIDGVGCAALKHCWSEFRSRLEAASKIPGERGSAALAVLNSDFSQCLVATRKVAIGQLLQRRRDQLSER